MPFIQLTTFIEAPVDRIFDLSRSIDLHKSSMTKYEEKPIAGTISGLINQGEEVTWKAKHFYKERILKVRITAMQKPFLFIDEQVQGSFKLMKHEHFFKPCDNGTIMIDQFYFDLYDGLLGKWLNRLYLTGYIKRLLEERNSVIKKVAEGTQWKHFLNGSNS
jgi:ligand-binding SRPBCC domain-containing protein